MADKVVPIRPDMMTPEQYAEYNTPQLRRDPETGLYSISVAGCEVYNRLDPVGMRDEIARIARGDPDGGYSFRPCERQGCIRDAGHYGVCSNANPLTAWASPEINSPPTGHAVARLPRNIEFDDQADRIVSKHLRAMTAKVADKLRSAFKRGRRTGFQHALRIAIFELRKLEQRVDGDEADSEQAAGVCRAINVVVGMTRISESQNDEATDLQSDPTTEKHGS